MSIGCQPRRGRIVTSNEDGIWLLMAGSKQGVESGSRVLPRGVSAYLQICTLDASATCGVPEREPPANARLPQIRRPCPGYRRVAVSRKTTRRQSLFSSDKVTDAARHTCEANVKERFLAANGLKRPTYLYVVKLTINFSFGFKALATNDVRERTSHRLAAYRDRRNPIPEP